MLDYLRTLWQSDSLAPHGICLLWRPELIWTHVVADSLIALAYFSIPVALATFVRRRPDVAFSWVFWCFAVFITACGATHVLSIWTLWNPDYGIEAVVKAFTALASVATAAALWPLLPKVLALPSPEILRQANRELQAKIEERDAALRALEHETAERLKTEEMLRQAQKMEAVGKLTGGVAHDFNNLLTVVIANLERAERRLGPDRDRVEPALRGALAGAEKAATLTQQLLAFARRQPLQPLVIEPAGLVGRLMLLMQRSVGERIAIHVEAEDEVWPVQVDPGQMENAILNLVSNARDAMAGQGRLVIRCANVSREAALAVPGLAEGEHVCIEVADDGCGMPDEVRERAFEPFFTTKPVGQGTGLGLSQVYGFVKQSGGHVAVASAPGEGTRVRLYLPRAAMEVTPALERSVA